MSKNWTGLTDWTYSGRLTENPKSDNSPSVRCQELRRQQEHPGHAIRPLARPPPPVGSHQDRVCQRRLCQRSLRRHGRHGSARSVSDQSTRSLSAAAMAIAQRIAIAQRSPRAGMPPSQQRSIILFGLGRHGSRGVRIPAELIQVCTACAPDHADAPDPLLRLVVVACIHVPRSTCRVSVYCKNI